MQITDVGLPKQTQSVMQAVKFLEHQIIALNNEWKKFEKDSFTDWNEKFKGLNIKDIKPYMQIPHRDVKLEKKVFEEMWQATIEILSKSIALFKKNQKEKALYMLFSNFKDLESHLDEIQKEENETFSFIKKHKAVFEPLFDNNFGKDYYQKKLMYNFEMRFGIIKVLKNEYDLVKYFLSDLA